MFCVKYMILVRAAPMCVCVWERRHNPRVRIDMRRRVGFKCHYAGWPEAGKCDYECA